MGRTSWVLICLAAALLGGIGVRRLLWPDYRAVLVIAAEDPVTVNGVVFGRADVVAPDAPTRAERLHVWQDMRPGEPQPMLRVAWRDEAGRQHSVAQEMSFLHWEKCVYVLRIAARGGIVPLGVSPRVVPVPFDEICE